MRSFRLTCAVAAACLVLGTGVMGQQSPGRASADDLAVRQMVAEFDRCARAKDLESFLSYALEDVVALNPDEPAVVGKKALREWYARFYAAFDITMTHQLVETHSFGELVVARGNATGTVRPVAGGENVRFDNKYLFVLKRQSDGSLKVWRAVFNANPPPGPRAT